MTRSFVSFLVLLFTLLGLSAYYVGNHWIIGSEWGSAHPGTVWGIQIGLVIFQISAPLLYRKYPRKHALHFVWYWLSYLSFGVFSIILIYLLLFDVVLLLSEYLLAPNWFEELAKYGFTAIATLTALTVGVGLVQALVGMRIYRVTVPVQNLSEELEGFRILQISDLHVGPTIGKKYVHRLVKLANSTKPHIVAFTGDLVDGFADFLKDDLIELKSIQSQYGSFFVTGNHEYYWNVHAWIETFKSLGLKLLLNSHHVVRHGSENLIVGGVPDRTAGRFFRDHEANMKKTFQGAPEGFRILLAHHPGGYLEALTENVDLQLSGHTHGGQFFPFSLLARIPYRVFKGLRKVQRLHVYVSRGTGYWGPPIRFGVPAEITLLTLKKSSTEI